jgi:hypothetical protein
LEHRGRLKLLALHHLDNLLQDSVDHLLVTLGQLGAPLDEALLQRRRRSRYAYPLPLVGARNLARNRFAVGGDSLTFAGGELVYGAKGYGSK